MVPATQTVMLHLLAGKHQRYTNWPQHQVMVGHTSRVNCLLYPNNEHPRYDVAHLVSGSVDFTVCLWDIYTGALLHRFCCQVNEEFYIQISIFGDFFRRMMANIQEFLFPNSTLV